MVVFLGALSLARLTVFSPFTKADSEERHTATIEMVNHNLSKSVECRNNQLSEYFLETCQDLYNELVPYTSISYSLT